MNKSHIKVLLNQAFSKGEQYGMLGESESSSDWNRADKLYENFKEWVENELDALDYV